jgi:hypothetical protein
MSDEEPTGESVLEDELTRLFAANVQARMQRVEVVLLAMTPRERRLVHEVAVMANVQGMMAVGQGVSVPPDSLVLANVLMACLGFEDLYPTVARLERLGVQRIRRAHAVEVTNNP